MNKSNFSKSKHPLQGFFLIIAVSIFSIFTSCKPEFDIDNPYENVNWEEYGRFKGDLHAHTSRSDGHLSPNELVDRFCDVGFRILSITDHNLITFPWQEFSSLTASDRTYNVRESELYYLPDEKIFVYENRDPDSLGMIAIQGNEISWHHHIGSYFCDFEKGVNNSNEQETLEAISAKNGLAVLNHPGDYNGSRPSRPYYPIDWYIELFQRFENLIGMEAYNTGLAYQPEHVNKWDSTLTRLMPDRPVWGFSNEDYHGDFRPGGEIRHVIGRNGNLFLLPELTLGEVRSAMENGVFFFFHNPDVSGNVPVPEINSIEVNSTKGTIQIEGSNYDYIEWISEGDVVHKGDFLKISDFPEIDNYVRAVLYNSKNGALTGTQPFGIQKN
ncbi:MAG: hypothetical protein HN778_04715 [Prolixibacteraceae bacterium]|jgi:hypothetical protein|nr:hypothetical protein [Prolixibacteraceae bacterium]MBT6004523.1 hypothetical protein [Prolixibacteraceae bacterium]MBT6763709.1 hypothetical protein [Prolixibacteraceae bacterium]MBT7000920.1 hypothetical protein [Prolixibacteraceae bacterium]MBT7394118.1 hypothetical protein [Prolixibacteraceae bacterium]